jgi:hypothetical protein
MDPITRDRNVATHEGELDSRRIHEAYADAFLILLDTEAPVSKHDGASAESLNDGREQHLLKVAPVDREVRYTISGVEAARLAVDELPARREKSELFCLDRRRAQRGNEPEEIELAHGMRLHIDTYAEGLELRG